MKSAEEQLSKIREAADWLKEKGVSEVETGIVLGTGLGRLLDHMDVKTSISYEDIPHFPVSTVEFHTGKLHFGTLAGKKVVALQGRFHAYEGYTMSEVAFPVRVMKMLGIKKLLLSNAAGAINPAFQKGDLMLVTDHINLFKDNPLIGPNIEELGTRFPDMSNAYDLDTRNVIRDTASSMNIELCEGVYVTAQGPMLETPAEYRYLRTVGGDAVGMSTVPEVIAAVHMGLPCAAVSVLTDECDPDNLEPIDVEDVIRVAGKAEEKLAPLFEKVVANL